MEETEAEGYEKTMKRSSRVPALKRPRISEDSPFTDEPTSFEAAPFSIPSQLSTPILSFSTNSPHGNSHRTGVPAIRFSVNAFHAVEAHGYPLPCDKNR